MAKTRGVAVDYVLEMASLDPVALEPLGADDLRATLAHLIRVAQGITHDQYLEQIEPWDEDGKPLEAESEGGDSD